MLIELQDIHKHYGPVKANNGVDLTIEPGCVHGILGENGAGKSTLMKILAGFCQPTTGAILVDGAPVDCSTPARASGLGIGMLYQDPLDFPELPVLENFMLGQPGRRGDHTGSFRERFLYHAGALNFPLRSDALVKTLTTGERQQLEIVRLMAKGTRVLILDEPTTGLSREQRSRLFQALSKLAREGKSILIVSHKLNDVEALCDRITVLRRGSVAGVADRPFDTPRLLQMMFGELPLLPPRDRAESRGTVLRFDGISASGGRTGLRDCSIGIGRREIVGLAGIEGSGQEAFLRVAAGLQRPSKGFVYLADRSMRGKEYHAFRREGVAFLPAARLEEGLIAGLNVAEHCALEENRERFIMDWEGILDKARRRIERFRIKGAPELPVESLSGGNQQRLLLSFLPSDPVLLLLENPTRGLDMESLNWVWRHLEDHRNGGASIVFSSSELDEILMVADRVLVFFEGMVLMDARTDEISIEELGLAIAGRQSAPPS